MENIIVPTDFSTFADNALRFGLDLAKKLKAKLHIVYVNKQEPSTVLGNHYKNMNSLKKRLDKHKDLLFECYLQEGFSNDMLVDLALQQAGLIVVGTQGAQNELSSWNGMDTSKIVNRRRITALSVPENFKGSIYSGAEFILATDFDLTSNWNIMEPFYEMAISLHANINVFYVKDDTDDKEITVDEKKIFNELTAFFKELHVSLHLSSKNDIVEAIDGFAKIKKASLVVMIAQENSWLDELLFFSVTRDMSLHGHIPLLTIPGSQSELNRSYSASYW